MKVQLAVAVFLALVLYASAQQKNQGPRARPGQQIPTPCRVEDKDGKVLRKMDCAPNTECTKGPQEMEVGGNKFNGYFCEESQDGATGTGEDNNTTNDDDDDDDDNDNTMECSEDEMEDDDESSEEDNSRDGSKDDSEEDKSMDKSKMKDMKAKMMKKMKGAMKKRMKTVMKKMSVMKKIQKMKPALKKAIKNTMRKQAQNMPRIMQSKQGGNRNAKNKMSQQKRDRKQTQGRRRKNNDKKDRRRNRRDSETMPMKKGKKKCRPMCNVCNINVNGGDINIGKRKGQCPEKQTCQEAREMEEEVFKIKMAVTVSCCMAEVKDEDKTDGNAV